jgi:hypothetical protein
MAPLTYEARVELLKKAREAKKNKKMAKDYAESEPVDEGLEPEKPKKTRAKKVKEAERTLEIKEPEALPDFIDSEPEIEEQIIYKPKEKKKKKIIRRVIMEASSDEEEVEVVEERVKAPKKVREHAPERPSVPETPKIEMPKKSPFFNF